MTNTIYLLLIPLSSLITSSPPSFHSSSSLLLPSVHLHPTDVLDRVRSHAGVDGVDGEDEDEGRAEEDEFQFTAPSAVVTNPLEAPTTSSSQGPVEFTNPVSELTSLGKTRCCCCCCSH